MLGINLAQLFVSIGADLSDLDEKMKNIDKSLSPLNNVAKKMGEVGKDLTAGITVPLVAVGGAAILSAKGFDESMDIITAKTGVTGKALDDMGTILKAAFIGNRQSMDDTATAMAMIYDRTGLTGQALQDLTTKVGLFSDTMKTDYVTTVDQLTSVQKSWNLTNDQTSQYLDAVTVASQKTGVSATDLMNGVAASGDMFKSLGYNVDQTTALLATFSEAGMDSGTVTAAMTQATNKLTTEQQKARDALASESDDRAKLNSQLAIAESHLNDVTTATHVNNTSVMEAKQKVSDLKDQLGDLDTAHKSNSAILSETTSGVLSDYIEKIKNAKDENEAHAIALEAFGPKGVKFADIIRSGKMNVDDLVTSMKDNQTAVSDNATATDSASTKFDEMQKKIGTDLIPIGLKLMDMFVKLEPTINKIIDFVGGLMDAFDKLDPNVQTIIIAVLALVAAIGPLLMALGMIIPAVGLIGTILGAPILVPIALVVAAIIGLVLIFVYLYDNCAWLRDGVKLFWDSICFDIDVAVKIIQGLLKIVGDLLRGDLTGAFNDLGDTVKGIFNAIPDSMKPGINQVIDFINGLISTYNEIAPYIGKTPMDYVPHVGGSSSTASTGQNVNPGSASGGNVPGAGAGKIPHQAFAEGAVFTKPVQFGNATFAENEPEGIIPLSKLGDIGGGQAYNLTIVIEQDGRKQSERTMKIAQREANIRVVH